MSEMAAAPVDALIGGKWVAGSGGTFEVRSPHSREVVNVVARCDPSDVDQAVAAARTAQPAWAALPIIERSKILRRIHQLFLERAEPIAQMLTAEIGKTITDSREEVYEYSAPSYNKAAEKYSATGDCRCHLPRNRRQTSDSYLDTVRWES
jgi:succinate-semialdehyde dehydrogenase/glutarate-semialdehyde dehydrogenase